MPDTDTFYDIIYVIAFHHGRCSVYTMNLLKEASEEHKYGIVEREVSHKA